MEEKPGAFSKDVALIQRRLGLLPTGYYDDQTQSAVMAFQLRHGLRISGTLTEATSLAIRGLVRAGCRPLWADGSEVVREARRRLGASPDEDLGAAVRRFQSARGLRLSGLLDDATVQAIGD